MNTYSRISDEALVVESIRRLRGRQIPKVDYVAHEGVNPDLLIEALGKTQMMTERRLLEALNQLMEEGAILTCGMTSVYGAVETIPKKAPKSKQGRITRFHPDAKLSSRQWFTETGTPITVQVRRNRQIFIPDSRQRIFLRKLRVYVADDGMPKTVQTAQKMPPINYWY